MFLRAGILAAALLVASRLLGLVRESAQAAAFGASGLGDIAVLMLALPDWIAGVLASGALAYVLIPAWARAPAGVDRLQRRTAVVLIAIGAVAALLLAVARLPVLSLLAAGLPDALLDTAGAALLWSAVAVPLALLAALWTTRLQHEGDVTGMYAANLVVNGVLVLALWWVSREQGLAALGVGLLAAMLLRLAWLHWRTGRAARVPAPVAAPVTAAGDAPAVPPMSAWTWAALAAGLPLALPFAARSIASQSGEGVLATFNYAWKLVELPFMLAIQLVATLAFPSIARGVAANDGSAAPAIRTAFALAGTLACAAAAALLLAGPALAGLLFGWGRMQPEALVKVAQWGQLGALGLLPQACIAVGLTVLAARGRMAGVVAAYALALGALLAAGSAGIRDGGALMLVMNALFVGVAIVVVAAMGLDALRALPWRTFGAAASVLLACLFALPVTAGAAVPVQVVLAIFGALSVIGVAVRCDPQLRQALRR